MIDRPRYEAADACRTSYGKYHGGSFSDPGLWSAEAVRLSAAFAEDRRIFSAQGAAPALAVAAAPRLATGFVRALLAPLALLRGRDAGDAAPAPQRQNARVA